jgi:hypothetical protein
VRLYGGVSVCFTRSALAMNSRTKYGFVRFLNVALRITSKPCSTGDDCHKGSNSTKQVLRGPIVTPDGSVLQGEVVIESDALTCVLRI